LTAAPGNPILRSVRGRALAGSEHRRCGDVRSRRRCGHDLARDRRRRAIGNSRAGHHRRALRPACSEAAQPDTLTKPMNWTEVDDFAFHVPVWAVLTVLFLLGLLVWRVGKRLLLAGRG